MTSVHIREPQTFSEETINIHEAGNRRILEDLQFPKLVGDTGY